eukprot:Anaeramoba_ignava/a225046_9.p1 GENE.a225046_9~~a225046_9.p1  ORF type:complete len:121 (+),score=36.07 a225046_9:173-535(+)
MKKYKHKNYKLTELEKNKEYYIINIDQNTFQFPTNPKKGKNPDLVLPKLPHEEILRKNFKKIKDLIQKKNKSSQSGKNSRRGGNKSWSRPRSAVKKREIHITRANQVKSYADDNLDLFFS